MMMIRIALAALLATVSIAGLAATARADDTGVAQLLHDVRREGKRMCLASHLHDGDGSAAPTRKAAELSAINAWAGFTSWEYGSDWAYWTRAASKKLACNRDGTIWTCRAEARPCK